MRRWAPSFSKDIRVGVVIEATAMLLLASTLAACGFIRELETRITGNAPETISPATVAVVDPPVTAASAHCHEVAGWRAGDAERRDLGPAIQDYVFKAAYAECMKWASPVAPAPVTVALAVSAPSQATNVHCREVAVWRAGDVERRDLGPAIQDHVFRAAYAECMKWASPEAPAPITVALAVSPR